MEFESSPEIPMTTGVLAASTSDRFLAKVVDSVVVFTATFCVALVANASRAWADEAFIRLLPVTLWVASDLLPGGSIGKRAYEMEILNIDGQPATLWQRVVRVALSSGPLLIALLVILSASLQGLAGVRTLPGGDATAGVVVLAILLQMVMSVVALVTLLAMPQPLHDRVAGTVVGTAGLMPARRSRRFEVLLPAKDQARVPK